MVDVVIKCKGVPEKWLDVYDSQTREDSKIVMEAALILAKLSLDDQLAFCASHTNMICDMAHLDMKEVLIDWMEHLTEYEIKNAKG